MMCSSIITAVCVVAVGIVMLVASALGQQGSRERSILTYNVTARQLHIRCPSDKVKSSYRVVTMHISRHSLGDNLTVWNTRDKGRALNDRITVLEFTGGVEAVLSHVTCADSAKYSCTTLLDPGSSGVLPHHHTDTEFFSFTGEPTVPVLTIQPRKARYGENEVITMTCDARVGTNTNVILWETRLPGKDFQPVVSENITISTTEVPCDVKSTSSLTHALTADDDNREWRCKLNQTHQEAVFIAAVQCVDTDGRSEGPPASRNTLLILVGVIAALFTTMVICVAVMTMLLRKQHSKTMSLTPSSSNYTTYSPSPPYPYPYPTRSLPPAPPPLGNTHSTYNSLHPESLDEGDDDETPPKMIRPYHQTSVSQRSSSVFISSSAIPPLEEDGQREGLFRGRRPGSDTRSGRSVYSNEEAIGRAHQQVRSGGVISSSNSSASHQAHCTLGNLKEWEAEVFFSEGAGRIM
ncbi:uncharacterized protein [Littorina saxatilis]|uniref:uncharacterized protein n=1 Tax=Littorina saxatilis TaxID=31220 RepID=UPI0038B5EF83